MGTLAARYVGKAVQVIDLVVLLDSISVAIAFVVTGRACSSRSRATDYCPVHRADERP